MRTLREAAGKTQIDVAAASQINQADVSRLESREDFDDYQVSTLRRYLAALGGHLEIVGAFGNKRIVISGVRAEPSAASPANTYQPSPRQVSRSSPSGRRIKKTRDRSANRRMTASPFSAVFVSSAGFHPDMGMGPNTY